MNSITHNKPVQVRKCLGLIKFCKKAVVTRKPHNLTSSLLLSSAQWETVFSPYLYFPSDTQLSHNPTADCIP